MLTAVADMWVLGLVLGRSSQLAPAEPPAAPAFFFFFKLKASESGSSSFWNLSKSKLEKKSSLCSVSFPSEGSDYMSIAPF